MPDNEILVLGSIAYDVIMTIPGLFYSQFSVDPGKQTVNAALTCQSREIRFGGTAGNISYNLELLETKHSVVTAVGKDFADGGYGEHFESEYRTLLLAVHEDEHTATCYIVNDKGNNQLLVFHEGASRLSENIELAGRIGDPGRYSVAINSPQNPNAMKKFSLALKSLGIPVAFDPGQMVNFFSKDDLLDILPGSKLLVLNEQEFDTVKRTTSLDIDGLLATTPAIVVTRGGEGASVFEAGKGQVDIPACRPEKVVETTGAGDGFRAGMMSCLAKGIPLEQAVRVGNVTGSFVVETAGGQTQVYSVTDVKERYLENYGEPADFL
ncbi:MAG: carbohydrate kinase family protein [Promethearchaeota archaeon]